MAELKIITQNLDRFNDYEMTDRPKQETDLDILEAMKGKYNKAGVDVSDVDIFAFQELGRISKKTNYPVYITETLVVKESLKENMRVSGRAEEIWDETFPWAEFVSYLDERDIEFAGKTIKIINFHSSPKYDLGVRYTLLRRISEIPKNRLIILLGDFNAAFPGQMAAEEKKFIRSAIFLEKITNLGFRECLEEESENGPRHTHSYGKIDHIFISESLFNLLRDSNPEKDKEKPYEIQYIHEVNRKRRLESKDAFTNHSGIKLTIELPDT